MAPKSQFILDRLGDFWQRFKERSALTSYWDGLIDLTSNIRLNLEQINRGKGLFTVPVLARSSPVLFVLDSTTATTVPAGYAAAYSVDGDISSIPSLTGNSDGTGVVLTEGVAYDLASAGVLAFRSLPPSRLFGENVYSNRQTVYKNFGFPIEFKAENSEAYKKQVQGLWFALWNGGTIGNMRLGAAILLGLPFVQKGTVRSVTANPDGTTTIVVDSETFILPSYLSATVLAGDVITNFKPLSTGADILDVIKQPDFFTHWDIAEAQKFFTFVPTVLAEVIAAIEAETGEIFDFAVIRNFLDKIKPAYTNYVIGVEQKAHDDLKVFLNSALIELRILATSTVEANYQNYLIIPAFVTLNSVPGATDLDRQENVKALPAYAMEDEVIAVAETFSLVDSDTLEVLA